MAASFVMLELPLTHALPFELEPKLLKGGHIRDDIGEYYGAY